MLPSPLAPSSGGRCRRTQRGCSHRHAAWHTPTVAKVSATVMTTNRTVCVSSMPVQQRWPPSFCVEVQQTKKNCSSNWTIVDLVVEFTGIQLQLGVVGVSSACVDGSRTMISLRRTILLITGTKFRTDCSIHVLQQASFLSTIDSCDV